MDIASLQNHTTRLTDYLTDMTSLYNHITSCFQL
jgi:hypothetical protein